MWGPATRHIESRSGEWDRARHFFPVGQRRLSSSNQFWTMIISTGGSGFNSRSFAVRNPCLSSHGSHPLMGICEPNSGCSNSIRGLPMEKPPSIRISAIQTQSKRPSADSSSAIPRVPVSAPALKNAGTWYRLPRLGRHSRRSIISRDPQPNECYSAPPPKGELPKTYVG
jgi:hypothetical protein